MYNVLNTNKNKQLPELIVEMPYNDKAESSVNIIFNKFK